MTTPLETARAARRAELHHIYATWIGADVAALKAARSATFRRDLPGCALGAGVAALAAVAILSALRSDSAWSDPWVIGRLVLGVAGLGWFARRFLHGRPDTGDSEMHGQDRQLDVLVGRLVAQVRPGATYEPWGRLDDAWSTVARFVDANRHHASHLVRWKAAGLDVAAGEATAYQYLTAANGTLDDESGERRFAGWVAMVRLATPRKWALRVRPRESAFADTCDDPRLVPVRVADLDETHETRATAAAGAAEVLAAPVVARVAAAARLGHRVHLAAAGTTMIVAVEQAESWFHRLHPRLDASHAVALGETLDTLHGVIEAAVDSGRAAAGGRP